MRMYELTNLDDIGSNWLVSGAPADWESMSKRLRETQLQSLQCLVWVRQLRKVFLCERIALVFPKTCAL